MAPAVSLHTPQEVMSRLQDLEREIAERQNPYEEAAASWARAQRAIKRKRAKAFLSSTGSVAERNAHADLAVADFGVDEEAAYEFHKAGIRTLSERASIGQSILRAQTRNA